MPNYDQILQTIKEIWCQELHMDNFSLEDDFFELGGNSLKLISVLDKIQKSNAFKAMSNLTIIELFDHPVLSDLVNLIQSKFP